MNKGFNKNQKMLCFACLKESENLKHLNEDHKMFNDFRTLFRLEVELEGYAKNICQVCTEQLNSFLKFYDQVKNSLECMRAYKKEQMKEYQLSGSDLPEYESEFSELDDDEPLILLSQRKQKLIKVPTKDVEQAIANYRKQCNQNTNCILCSFVGVNIRNLSLHMKHKHIDKRNLWCSRCNLFYEDLQTHLENHNNYVFCSFCKRNLSSNHFLDHLRAHADLKYKCNLCNKKFISQELLTVHLAAHENTKPFECLNCSKRFRKLHTFEDHIKMHGRYTLSTKHLIRAKKKQITKMKIPILKTVKILGAQESICCRLETKQIESLTCQFCQKSYTTAYKLQMHIKGHLGKHPFKCVMCQRGFARKSDCLNHERTHTKEKTFICKICGKGLSSSATLRVHLKQHTGRPEKCEICQKQFCRKSELTLHMQKHRGERPFLCTECGMSFAQSSHLTSHVSIHSEARPFKCQSCDKTFKTKELLKVHMRLHGEKRFKCCICMYQCHKNYRLQQHMKMHQGRSDLKSNVCQLCNKGFSSAQLLNSHLANTHNVIC
ncbi:gastrula zinc finger protein XlCGF57.1-like isoform X2 [Cylas formicarius]|uniref:gastrula zinc finger protein XlCGF57.1-like isoform X2 n=1 Tax=Cylas formicarius TaxID=197179 RepID=UPI002958D0B4|nr:gastrula zinc finger protein XlCGF57.1-like isoform X2 [Cylas formicarius]